MPLWSRSRVTSDASLVLAPCSTLAPALAVRLPRPRAERREDGDATLRVYWLASLSLKVLVTPVDQAACGFARLRWPAIALAAQGFDVSAVEPNNRGVSAVVKGGHVIAATFPECDVLCLQRPTSQNLVECIPFIQARGTAVVVDFDDDLSTISPGNVAFGGLHPKRDPANNWRWSEEAARLADLVTVSTPPLAAKYGSHGRVRVLRNCVPDHYLTTEPNGERWAGFGWAGAVWSHPDDLQTLGPSVARLVRVGHEFRTVGPPDGVGRALGLGADPEATGLLPFHLWAREVARLEVGIAPLKPTVFSEAKSAWKALEYASLGVPFVAGPTSEYRRLAALGAGVIAEKPKDWYRLLSELLASEGLRDERAGKAREVVSSMTYSLQAHQWADAWEFAAASRRAQPVAAR